MLAGTSDAVMAGDLDGRITVFNPGAEKMFGCTAEEVLGSPIMLHAEMLIMDLPEESPIQPGLKHIYRAGERARDLVGQILAFAREKEEDRIPLKAFLILKECLRSLRSTLPSAIAIHRDLKTDRDTVLADPTQFNQIVMHLCIDAAQAMEDAGGLIEIVLENDAVDAESANRLPSLEPGDYMSG